MTKAELERQRYRLQRMTILEELQKHLRKQFDQIELAPLENVEFAPEDLRPFIK